MEKILKNGSGIMVCLFLPGDVAEELAFPGGEPAEDLHVTLAYVPKLGEDEEAFKAVCRSVLDVASQFAPALCKVGGIGVFNATPESDGKSVYYASINGPILPALASSVSNALDWAGIEVSRKHGFVPHCTLKYLDGDEQITAQESEPFRVPCLTVASRTFRCDIPFTGTRISKSQPSSSQVHVNSPIGAIMPIKRKKKAAEDPETPAPAQHPVAPPTVQTPGWQYPQENNEDVEYLDAEKCFEQNAKKVAKDFDLDVAGALAEFSQMDEHDIEEETAAKWTSRAIAVFMLAQSAEDDERAELVDWGDDLYHEALEHASLVKDYGKTVQQVQDAVEEYREKVVAKAALSSKGRDRIKGSNFAIPSERKYPIHDIAHARNALARASGKPEESKVRAAVYRKYPSLDPRNTEKSAGDLALPEAVQIHKLDAKKQIVYGVVLEPDSVDLQGDIMTADEIEKTAHDYMENARNIGRRHQTGIDAFPVESYIAPVDIHIEDGPYGPTTIRKGSWVLGVKVSDPNEWAKVENGEYTGFSVGGTGVRDAV